GCASKHLPDRCRRVAAGTYFGGQQTLVVLISPQSHREHRGSTEKKIEIPLCDLCVLCGSVVNWACESVSSCRSRKSPKGRSRSSVEAQSNSMWARFALPTLRFNVRCLMGRMAAQRRTQSKP